MSQLIYSGPEVRITPAGPNVYSPEAVNLTGGRTLVFHTAFLPASEDKDGGRTIVYDIFDAKGATVGAGRLSLANDSADALVKPLADGGFVVAWTRVDNANGGGSTGLTQRFDASGKKVGPENVFSDLEPNDRFFSLALVDLGDDRYGLVDNDNLDGGTFTYNLRIFGANGRQIGDPVRLSDAVGVEAVNALESGDLLIVERKMVAIGEFVREAFVVGQDGVKKSAGVELLGSTTSITKLDDGRFVVLSAKDGADGVLQFLDKNGRTSGKPVEIDAPGVDMLIRSQVVAMEDGKFALFYDAGDPTNGSNGSDIFGWLFNAKGRPIGDPFVVNREIAGRQDNVGVSYRNGEFTIAWEDYRNGPFSSNAIYLQKIKLVDDAAKFKPTDIELSNLTIAENLPAGSLVANIKVVDRNVGETYKFALSGQDADDFRIVDGRLEVARGAKLDFEQDAVKQIVIKVTDSSGLSYSEKFKINLIDLYEPITGGGGADRLKGTKGDDHILGLGGADTLTGAAGDDTLDGGTRGDEMRGGLGDDVYIVDSIRDLVIEQAAGGLDTVFASISHTLAANVENLELTGDKAIEGVGNTLANLIRGNSAANRLEGGDGVDTLEGGAGDDSLIGGSGVDRLIGGDGADTFVITASGPKHADVVVDFRPTDDVFWVDSFTFQGPGVGALGRTEFVIGRAAKDRNDYVIYDDKTGKVLFDADGSRSGKAVLIATVDKDLDLSHLDFLFV